MSSCMQPAAAGTCPRCGKELERGHKAHLAGCGGERPPRQPRARDQEELGVRLVARAGRAGRVQAGWRCCRGLGRVRPPLPCCPGGTRCAAAA